MALLMHLSMLSIEIFFWLACKVCSYNLEEVWLFACPAHATTQMASTFGRCVTPKPGRSWKGN